MSRNEEIDTRIASGDEGGDDPVARALADWRERRDRGEDVSIEDVCAEQPQLAGEIRVRAAALEALARHLRGDRERDAAQSLQPVRADRYKRFKPAGEGGMGIVYWAIDTDLNREVAFKVVRPSPGKGETGTPAAPGEITPPAPGTPASSAFETLKARFLQEAWVTAGMSHPGIVPVYELGETQGGVPFYTMRFVRGSLTLARAIEEARTRPWDARAALLEPFLKVCDTMSYAHARGVVHRDLKPENVALGEFGEAVVLDWGLAKIEDRPDAATELWRERIEEFRASSDLKTLASALGTPGYMSPEAALGRLAEVDARSDVYSLGAILYRILTGRPPFEFQSYGELMKKLLEGTPPEPHEIDASVPPALSRLAVRALSKNRDARPASAAALAQEIRDWQVRTAADREADALLRDANSGMLAAERLRGADAADALDRAATALTQVGRLRPGDAAAAALRVEVVRRREVAVKERERIARARTARRALVGGLVAALVAAAAVAVVIDQQRRETATARDEAARERDAKSAALAKEKEARERADAEGRRARSLGLAHAAAERVAQDPQLALLLARESVRTVPSRDGLSRLHDALSQCFERRRIERAAVAPAIARFLPDGRVVVAGIDGSLRICDRDGRTQREVAGPRASPTAFAVAASGAFACGFADASASIWTAAGDHVADLPGHSDRVGIAAWSPDGGRLLTLEGFERDQPVAEARARVWDASGRLLRTLGDGSHVPSAAAFAHDGRSVVTGGGDGSVALWDESGARRWTIPPNAADRAQDAPVGAIAAVADGSIAWVHAGGRFRLASPDGRIVADSAERLRPCRTLRVAPDGTRIATIDQDSVLTIRDVTGRVVRVVENTQPQAAVVGVRSSLAWTRDGSRIATGSADGTIRLWTADGVPAGELRGHPMTVTSFDSSADGRTFLSTGNDLRGHSPAGVGGDAIIWAPRAAEDLLLDCGGRPVTNVAWSRDGAMLAAAGVAGTFAGRADGSELTRLDATRSHRAEFSPDGRLLADVTTDGTRIWDVARASHVDLPGKTGGVPATIWSPDGSLLLAIPADGTVRIWAADGAPRAVLKGHSGRVAAARFAPDGGSVLTAADDSSVRRWSLSGELIETHETAGLRAISLDLARDGTLAAGFMDAQVRLWRRGGSAPRTREIDGWVTGLSYLPGGDLLLTTMTDTASIVSADLARLTPLRGHTGRVVAATATPDGSIVATASEDGTARLWTADGAEVATLSGHRNAVTGVAFSPDGARLATCSADGTVRTWLAGTDALLRLADARATRVLHPTELARYGDLLGGDERLRLRGYRVAEEAFEARLLHDESKAAIEARTDLEPALRAAAVAELRFLPEDPFSLNEAAWKLCVAAGRSAADCERAVRLARAAVTARGEVPDEWNTLGLALVRAGRADEALDALRRATSLRRPSVESADDAIVLALAHAARGAAKDAAEALDRAKTALAASPPGTAEQLDALLKEAERAVSGKR